jgi:GNAT superfamily N-acetyltransferase
MPDPSGAMSIREASPADAEGLAVLRFRFRSALGAAVEEEAAFVARVAPWLRARIGRPPWRAWVAVDAGGALVGNIFLQLVEKLPNPVVEAETIGYITNLYVEPARRGRGLGGRLLRAALAACPPETVDTVILWPTPESVALYRRAGFEPPAGILERSQRQGN